jgi:hypothetical protein
MNLLKVSLENYPRFSLTALNQRKLIIKWNRKTMQNNKEAPKEMRKTFQFAKSKLLTKKIGYKPIQQALKYFFCEFAWHYIQLLTDKSFIDQYKFADSEKLVKINAALLLVLGATDVHYNLINKHKLKNSKLTLYGKFGGDIALLVGDALLIMGLNLLYKECGTLPMENRMKITAFLSDFDDNKFQEKFGARAY